MANSDPDSSPNKCHHKNPIFSQCTPLRKIGRQIVDLCHTAENVTTDDFKLLLDDNITSLSQQDNDDGAADVLAASISSLDSSSSRDDNEQPVNRPFVPFSVEEISLVTKLDYWSNCNVRVIGIVSPISNSNSWSLVSIGEEGGPFSVVINMELINQYPSPDSQVQVFGEIQISNSNPIIRAKFFRNFSSVDILFYNKALEELKKYVPHFINKKKLPQLCYTSEADEETD